MATQEVKKKRWSYDFFIVAGVMTAILLPVRLIFVTYVSNDTWGSLGVISLISVIMVVLVKKKRLGSFGRLFEKEMIRLTRGKKRLFVTTMMTVMVMYFSFSLFLIDQANTVYFDEKERVKVQVLSHYGNLNLQDPEDVLSVLEPEKVIAGVPEYADSALNDIKAMIITQGIVNDLSNGYILHFHSVFLVEGLEILGVYIFYAVSLRKREVNV